MSNRRQNIHELVLALISKQPELGLLQDHQPTERNDPAQLLERNKRIIHQYQNLVRTAITIDILIEQESRQAGTTETPT